MLVRIGRDTETIAPFQDASFDPGRPFEAMTPDESFLDNAMLDPGLLVAEMSLTPEQLATVTAEVALSNVLRQQQYIVFDLASRVGVLAPFVGATQNALKAFDVILTDLDADMATAEAITTGIGIAGTTLSAIPTIYTQIAGAVINVGLWIANLFIKQQAGLPLTLPAQAYSKETDVYQFNHGIRSIMRGSFDWTPIFSPRFKGELAAEVRTDRYGSKVVSFAPGDGRIARVAVHGIAGKRHTVFPDDGTFQAAGGLGMIPGGQRILSVVQVTPTEPPVGPKGGHATVYDPRCGSMDKARAIDTGSWYPVTAQGAMSLWDFVWQRGAALYTIDTNACRNAWRVYFNEVWRGVDRTWGSLTWQGDRDDEGWGCGFWQNALQELVANYTVGIKGNVGGALSWRPPTFSENYRLGSGDEDDWEKYNAYAKIIKPALDQLEDAQIWYLDNTTLAAYLPIEGGRDADPLAQSKVMGAFSRHFMRKKFVDARNRIINGHLKFDVRLRDVLDPVYRQEIRNAGGGTDALELGFKAAPPGAPGFFEPEGGSGLPDLGLLPMRPDRPPSWPFIAGGAAIGGTALAYYFWDDLARVLSAARDRLPPSVARRLPRAMR